MEGLKGHLDKLELIPRGTYDEVTKLLIKIADNILKEPRNLKVRTLQKNNVTVTRKILGINGALGCLLMMGFEENDSTITLPPSASLSWLEIVKNEISKERDRFLNIPKNPFENLISTVTDGGLTSSLATSSAQATMESSDQNISTSYVTSSEAITSQNSLVLNSQLNNELPEQNDLVCRAKKEIIIPHNLPKVNLPSINYMFTNDFLRQIELAFHTALVYHDKDLQKRALSLIPEKNLQIAAQKRLRTLQEQVKKGNMEDPNISLEDLLILELLSWFKSEFFTWVDSPDCSYCDEKTKFSHISSDPAIMVYTTRVEMYRCTNCRKLTAFPRYDDLNILLLTRRGRCGEWSNTFTLVCCAMGFDARLVIDQNDHVWTEVYSYAQKRWLHCDPCENICDSPLIYENGWKKKLTYVLAYSPEEVQDVTWRYSSHHKEVLSRRNKCTEKELINAMIKLRTQRQKILSPARIEFLTKRLLAELVELMIEKKPNETDKQGRISGSESWRLSRGEIQENCTSAHIWTLKKSDVNMGNIIIRYCTALDQYEYIATNKFPQIISNWHSFVFCSEDIFRKEEKDWKMVYLTRREGKNLGKVSWKFVIEGSEMVINVIDIKFEHKLYENGKIEIQIDGDNTSINFPTNVSEFRTKALSGSSSITITASLSGGKGDVAWQHAQLFRQSIKSKEYPFSIIFNFKSKNN